MKRLLMVCAAAAVLAACGSLTAGEPEVASLSTAADGDVTTDSSDSADATDTTVITDPEDAALEFAKCMREHGIDMPDPVIGEGGGGVMVRVGGGGPDEAGSGPDPEDFEAANKGCQHFMDDVVANFDPPSEEDQKKMQEEALAFSKCIREHGIDMPDPQFSADGGGMSVSIGSPADGPSDDGPLIDFSSEEFEEASEACGQPGGGFAVAAKPVDG